MADSVRIWRVPEWPGCERRKHARMKFKFPNNLFLLQRM